MKRNVQLTVEWKHNVVEEGFVGEMRNTINDMLESIDELKSEMMVVVSNVARSEGDKRAHVVDSGVSLILLEHLCNKEP